MNKIANYYIKFNEKIEKTISKTHSFSSLYNALKMKRINFYERYNFDEIESRLIEFKKVLDKITSIVYSPHIEVTKEEAILRSEVSGNLSRDAFFDTTRDTKLWKQKGNEMSPEFVHTFLNTDTILNYENRFIALLLDKINEEFVILKNSMEFVGDSLEENFEVKGFGYSEHSIFNSFKDFSYPYEGIFVKPSSKVSSINKLIIRINKRIKNIKGTEFYLLNSRKKMDSVIMPTNVLLHDEKYNYCYRYYRTNYLITHKEDFSFETYFYNYIVASLFSYLTYRKVAYSKKNIAKEVKFDENKKLHFEEISFKKGIFSYSIREDEDEDGVIIETTYHAPRVLVRGKAIKQEKSSARYYILPVYTLDEDSLKLVDQKVLALAKKYDNVILVTSANIIHDYNYVMTLSLFKKNHEILFNNLFSSLSMLFVVDTDEYKYKCPVCGEKTVYQTNKGHECESCNAHFSFVKYQKEKALWIKSFRRKY